MRGKKTSLLVAIGIAFALCAAAAPPPAAAQDRPSAASRKKARKHYQKAKAFQEAGRYTEAIAEYEAAHDAVPDPAFLYNIARCLHLAGERERAIETYDAYLAERSSGEIADEAKSFAAELRAELAAEKEAAREAAAAERARELAPARAVADREDGAGGRSIDLSREEERPAPRRSTARRVAWIAGGAALIGAGVLVDTLPDSGHNGTLEATDFVPVGLYLAGLAAVAIGIF
ncbi:MAG TPA: tetratricopeptide repeat protein [Kofleriaceae bacterium]|nr:tetratricopeptide repeat protein [Kofleriaceae bacterium]